MTPSEVSSACRVWWGKSEGGFDLQTYDAPDGGFPSLSASVGDFNGDGRADVQWFAPSAPGVWYGNADRTWIYDYDVAGLEGFEGRWIRIPGDYNGDGMTDLFMWDEFDKEIWYATNPNAGTPPPGSPTPDGNWRRQVDIAGLNGTSMKNYLYNDDHFRGIPGDFDGDGATELLLYFAKEDGRTHPLSAFLTMLDQLPDGSFVHNAVVAEHDPESSGFPDGATLSDNALARTGDFNGDGATDIVWYKAGSDGLTGDNTHGRWLWLSKVTETGTAFAVFANLGGANGNSAYEDSSISVGDFNGDGLDDLHWFQHSGAGFSIVWTSRGDGIFDGHLNGGGHAFAGTRIIDDFNGDGTDEILWWKRESSVNMDTWLWTHGDAAFPDLLNRIVDGLGATTAVDYLALSAQADYDALADPLGPSPPWASTYPVRGIPPTQCVADAVHFDDGLEDADGEGPDGTFTIDYAYEGSRFDLERRRFLGFHAVATTDSRDSRRVRSTYSQEFPFEGKVLDRIDYTDDGGILREDERTWRERILAPSQSRLVFLERSSASDWEDPDPVEPAGLRRRVTVYNEFDDWGNRELARTTTTSDPLGLELHVEEVATTFHPPDTATWLINLRSSETTTRIAPDLSFDSLTTTFDFDPDTGLENYRLTGQFTDTWLLPEITERDASGNVALLALKGSGMADRVTATDFDATGRFAEVVTNPAGHVSVESRSPGTGQLEMRTDPNGLVSKFSYDAIGREVWRVLPDGTVSSTEYLDCTAPVACAVSAPLAIRQSQDGESPVTTYFDELQRSIAVETAGHGGEVILSEVAYDQFGRASDRVREHFAGAPPQPVHTEYDEVGRPELVRVPGAHDTTFEYAVVAGRSRRTSTQGSGSEARVIVEDRDALGRVVGVIDGEENETTYEYDPFGNLMKTIDNDGNVYLRTFDRWGHLRSITDPDRGFWQFDYDAVGNVVVRTDAKNQTATITYDGLDRPLTRTELEGPTIWTYDMGAGAIGSLSIAEGPGYVRENHYDALGRLSWHETELGMRRFGFGQTYDAHSRPQTTAYASGVETSSLYSATGHLEAVADTTSGELLWQASAFDAGRRPTQVALASAQVHVTRLYDDPQTNLPEQIDISSGSGLASYVYAYTGFLDPYTRSGVDPLEPYRSETFLHDRMGRLKSSSVSSGVEIIYSYDGIGNLTGRTDLPSFGFDPDRPHQITSVGSSQITYDANGTMETDGTRTIEWTSFHRPIEIEVGGVVTKTYSYGPERELVVETSAGAVDSEVYRIDGEYELEVSNGAISEERTWVMVPDRVSILVVTGSGGVEEFTYSVNDPLGSPLARFDSAGTAIDYLSFGPFGEFRSASWLPGSSAPGDSWDHYFTGQELDAETGYYNYGARQYDPGIGIFLSPDPLIATAGEPADLNPYAYVQNRPLTLVDPTGLYSEYTIAEGWPTYDYQFDTVSFDRGSQGGYIDSIAFSAFDTSLSSFSSFDSFGFDPFSFNFGANSFGADLFGGSTSLQLDSSAFVDYGTHRMDFQREGFGVEVSQGSGGSSDGLAFVPSPAGGTFPAIVSADRFQESLDASIVANSAVAGAGVVVGGLAAGAALSGPALLTLGAGLPPVVQSAGPKLADLATRFGTTSPALLQNVLQNGARFADTANKSVNVLLRRPDSTGFIRVTLDPAQQRVISSGLVRARNVANSIANGRFVPLE